jgi:hypothetical protein
MFVQSEKFVEAHGGRIGDIAIYGQESNYTTWRLAKMNLAVRGIDADIRWNNAGSFHKDEQATSRPTTSSPTRRSTSPTGAANDCATTCAGIRSATGRQRQLRVAAAHLAPPGADGHRRRGARQRLHEFAAAGEGEIRRR